jgi:histone chaperone ASF1
MQAALETELAETEAAVAAAKVNGEDHDMVGSNEETAKVKDEDEVSDAGSEDLEAESSGSEDEEDDEEAGEGDGDEDLEMGDAEEKPATDANTDKDHKPLQRQGQQEVLVH